MGAFQHQPLLSVTCFSLDLDLEAALQRITTTPIRHIQWNAAEPGYRPRDLDSGARRGLLEKLRRLELELSGVDLWIPPEHFLSDARVDRALTAVKSAIEFSAVCGRVPVSLALPRQGKDTDSALNQLESIQSAVAGWADHFGVEIADHGLPRCRHEVIRIGIDPAASLALGEDPISTTTSYASHLSSLRLCDLLRSGLRGPIAEPGNARLDDFRLAVAAMAAGYERPVVIDTRQWSGPWSGVLSTIERWTRALELPSH